MVPAAAPIRDLLTSFSPDADFLALSSGDGRIKVWDAVRGRLQTEFADIPSVEVGAVAEAKRGHLALDYTCIKWVQLNKAVGMYWRSMSQRDSGSGGSAIAILDGKILATAAGQLRTFNTSDNKKIQKFYGHLVAVRSMVFSNDGQYVLSSGVGERYVAIWNLGGVPVQRIEDDSICIEDIYSTV